MKISLNAQAELELVEGATYYAREASAGIADAFVSEFNRSASLLVGYPTLGSIWRGRIRRLAATPIPVQHRLLLARIRGPNPGRCSPAAQARLLEGPLVRPSWRSKLVEAAAT